MGLVHLAALKAFGLLEKGESKGTFRLSNLALDILVYDPQRKDERLTRIQEAALKPAMHSVLWEKYRRDLPASDNSIRAYLVRERNFTEAGAKQLISQYRATLAFARLTEDGNLSDERQDEPAEGPPPVKPAHGEQVPSIPSVPSIGKPGTGGIPLSEVKIPIPGTPWPSLIAAFPMSEDAWTKMLEVLEAMKSGLVAPQPPKGTDGDREEPN